MSPIALSRSPKSEGKISSNHWLVLTILIALTFLSFSFAGTSQASSMRHCSSATGARGVSCPKALKVVQTWYKKTTSDCGPDGHTCRVLGYACVVPVNSTSNGTLLNCTKESALIVSELGAY